MTSLSSSEQRVADALARHGLGTAVTILATPATTAQMAAEAIGVEVARIVKSLIFRGTDSGTPCLLLVSGANRVHEKRTGRQLGEKLERADVDFVRAITGFPIGGVSPLGHPAPIRTVIDQTLFDFDTVWAAAGTPRAVFETTPIDLQRCTQAVRMDVT